MMQYLRNNDNTVTSVEMLVKVPVNEGKILSKNVLAMVERVKKEEMMKSCQYKALRVDYEARTYCYLAMLNFDVSEEYIACYKKARKIYDSLGIKNEAKACQNSIDACRIMLANDGDEAKANDSIAEIGRENYEHQSKMSGLMSEHAMRYGLDYARALFNAHRCIKAERLAVKLATDSRRVHGPDHNCTLCSDELVRLCKTRCVTAMPTNTLFQTLRYKDDGEMCIVTGPIIKPRQVDDEQEYHFTNDLIFPTSGCPVICHGLVSASHLNGKLGEVRAFVKQPTGTRLEVHFEEKSQKPSLVKPENLRVAFEFE